MTSPNQRSALAALNQARPTIARLDISRHPEDLAADVIEGWNGTEIALRSLVGGSALSGQALIRELRQREMLSLAQAHALMEFLAARDRAQRTDYRPSSADIAAARHGFQELEGALTLAPAEDTLRPAAASPAGQPVPDTASAGARHLSIGGGASPWRLAAAALVIVLLVGGGWFFFQWWSGRADRSIQRGAELYRERRLNESKRLFEDILRDFPDRAEAHIYLGRIAREEGDVSRSREHLTRAVELAPANGTAHRELATLLFMTGNYPLARDFYIRAVSASPNDRLALGMLGCTMIRLGRPDAGVPFLQRAGQGEWNRACPMQPAPPA